MFELFGLFLLFWAILLILVMVFFWKLRSDEELIKKLIKWRNNIQGIETKITPTTIRWVKSTATFGLVLGVIMLLIVFLSFSGFFSF